MTIPVLYKHDVDGALIWKKEFNDVYSGKVADVCESDAFVACIVNNDAGGATIRGLDKSNGDLLFVWNIVSDANITLQSASSLDVKLTDPNISLSYDFVFSSADKLYSVTIILDKNLSLSDVSTPSVIRQAETGEFIRVRIEKGTSAYKLAAITKATDYDIKVYLQLESGTWIIHPMSVIDSAERVGINGSEEESLRLEDLSSNKSVSSLKDGVMYTANKDTKTIYKIDFNADGLVYKLGIPEGVVPVSVDPSSDDKLVLAHTGKKTGASILKLDSMSRVDPNRGRKFIYDDADKTLTIKGTGDVICTHKNVFRTVPWKDHTSSVKTVVVSQGITGLMYNDLKQLTGMTDLDLPNSIEYIGPAISNECSSLADVWFNNTEANVNNTLTAVEQNNVPYIEAVKHYKTQGHWDVGVIAETVFADLEYDGTLTIYGQGAMKSIPQQAVYGCWRQSQYKKNVNKVIIQPGVTTIGDQAFYGCSNISSVSIPDTVTSIGVSAFRSVYALEELTVPDSVTTISNYAFSDSRMTKLTIGSGVTSIGQYALNAIKVEELEFRCDLRNVTIGSYCIRLGKPENNPEADVVVKYPSVECGATAQLGYMMTPKVDTSSWINVEATSPMVKFRVPEYDKDIAFATKDTNSGSDAYCIAFTDGTMIIRGADTAAKTFVYGNKNSAVYGTSGYGNVRVLDCSNYLPSAPITKLCYTMAYIEKVILPPNLVTISASMLRSCTALQEIVMPDSITLIESNAIDTDASLRSLTLSKSINTMKAWAVNSCTNLSRLYFRGSKPTSMVSNSIMNLCKSEPLQIYVPEGDSTWDADVAAGSASTIVYRPQDYPSIIWHRWNPETGEVLS